MRSRLFIPAAILVAVAYVKGRQDAQLFAAAARPATPETPAPPAPGPTDASIMRAQAEAADAGAGARRARRGRHRRGRGRRRAGGGADRRGAGPGGADRRGGAGRRGARGARAAAQPRPAVGPGPRRCPGAGDRAVRLHAPRTRLGARPGRGCPSGSAPPPVAAAVASTSPAASRWAAGPPRPGTWPSAASPSATRLAGPIVAGRVAAGARRAARTSPPSGLVVLGDAGFAPDAEGFTLLVAADGPRARSPPPAATS